MKILLIFSLLLFHPLISAEELHQRYLDVRKNLYLREYDAVFDSVFEHGLTEQAIQNIGSHPFKFAEQFPFISSINSSIHTELSYFSQINPQDSFGCLSVNGLGVKDRPVTLSLSFVKEESTWKISHVKIDLLNDYDQLYTQADCSK